MSSSVEMAPTASRSDSGSFGPTRPNAKAMRADTSPRTWSKKRKIYDTILVILLEAITTLISNTGSTAAEYAHHDLKTTRTAAVAAFASTYLVGQAIGAVVFPPFTETFGRKKTYVLSTLLYALFTLLIIAHGPGQRRAHLAPIVVGRFCSGIMSAIPSVVAIGSMEDMWSPAARVFPIQGWVSVSVAALVIGPAYATVIAKHWGWRSIYAISSIVVGFQAVALLFIGESRPVRIPEAMDGLPATATRRPVLNRAANSRPALKTFAEQSLTTPVRLFFREPLVFAITLMSATVFSLLYLFTEALVVVYADFDISKERIAHINTLMAIGPVFPLLVRARDIQVARKIKAAGKQLKPEDKLLGFFVAAPILAAAFWIFAWTIPPAVKTVPPWVSAACLVPIGYAANEFDHVLSSYLADAYGPWAGSANAPLAFLRAILSAVFPLVGAAMFRDLGSNVAGSVLAGMATLYCGVAVWFFFRAERLRLGSRFIRKNAQTVEERQMEGDAQDQGVWI